MIQTRQIGAAALLTAMIGVSGSAWGVEPISIGVFTDWTAYTYKASDTKVCFTFLTASLDLGWDTM